MFAAIASLVAATCTAAPYGKGELNTVAKVDLKRYTGKWYEIATIPSWFQKGCVGTTAEYSMREDGAFRVENTCREKTLDGAPRSIVGKSWVTDSATNAKLDVQFFWPFSGGLSSSTPTINTPSWATRREITCGCWRARRR